MQKFILLAGILLSTICFADLPYNELWRYDNKFEFGGVTEAEFRAVIKEVAEVYEPIADKLGFSLNIDGDWEDSTVNAYTSRNGNEWYIAMFGGLARRAEVTRDGFMLVVCHEMAHQMGGFPQNDWASYEGQSDYVATHVCARKVFKKFPKIIKYDETAIPRACLVWSDPMEQKICMRNLVAGQSLGNLLAALGNAPMPNYSTPDKTIVKTTQSAHPKAQCRLDTYLAGSTCPMEWDDEIIPTAKKSVCENRPRCWFNPE